MTRWLLSWNSLPDRLPVARIISESAWKATSPIFRLRYRDSREWRLGHFRKGDIVKADDGQLSRDGNAAIVGTMSRSDCHQVIRREDSGRRLAGQKLRAGKIPAFDAEIRIKDILMRRIGKLLEEGLLPDLSGLQVFGSPYESDVFVTQIPQISYRLFDAFRVIDDDVAGERAHLTVVQKDGADIMLDKSRDDTKDRFQMSSRRLRGPASQAAGLRT